jgi:hypothetical protein
MDSYQGDEKLSASEPAADQTKKALHPCPQCSREMESGYLLTPTFFLRSVRWSTHWVMDPIQLKGEKIVPTDWWGSIKIAGYRCKDCRLLVLTY